MNLQKVKQLMKEQNMTAYTLSKKTGISQAAIGQWLNGKNGASVTSLQKLADCFEVPINELLENE
jgi:DNA-binding helix-turn-helix protein